MSRILSPKTTFIQGQRGQASGELFYTMFCHFFYDPLFMLHKQLCRAFCHQKQLSFKVRVGQVANSFIQCFVAFPMILCLCHINNYVAHFVTKNNFHSRSKELGKWRTLLYNVLSLSLGSFVYVTKTIMSRILSPKTTFIQGERGQASGELFYTFFCHFSHDPLFISHCDKTAQNNALCHSQNNYFWYYILGSYDHRYEVDKERRVCGKLKMDSSTGKRYFKNKVTIVRTFFCTMYQFVEKNCMVGMFLGRFRRKMYLSILSRLRKSFTTVSPDGCPRSQNHPRSKVYRIYICITLFLKHDNCRNF